MMGRARRLYQDRFCGLQLNGERADYENHCRGEACEYFAPAHLLTLRQPVGELTPALPGPPAGQPVQPTPSPLATAAVVTSSSAPLVTAIMPTRQRPEFALQAIFGEMSGMLTGSQRVLPRATEAAGYRFQYPDLEPALRNILGS